MNKSGCRGAAGCLALVFTGYSADAASAELNLAGNLGQQLEYNDNMSFRATGKDPAFGYILMPGFSASRKTGSLELGLRGSGNIRRFDDSRWDCNGYTVGSDNAFLKRLHRFSLSANYNVGCAYTQQLQDTGILIPNTQFETVSVSPAWHWRWTPRAKLNAETSFARTRYDKLNDTVFVGFSGNDIYTASLSGDYLWSRRLSLNGGFYFSSIRYTEVSTSDQTWFGFQMGGDYFITRQWKLSAGAGPRWLRTRQSLDGISIGDSSVILDNVANISLDYSDRRTVFSMGYSKTINPSALGLSLQNHAVFANYSYLFTDRLTANLGTSYMRSETAGGNALLAGQSPFNRDYFYASAGLSWQFAKDWQLKGEYLYRWQKYRQTLEATDANLVMVSLNYAWPGIRDSR